MSVLALRIADLLLGFAVVAAIFVPLERTFTARRQGHLREGAWLDLQYFGLQYLVMMGALLAFNRWLQSVVGPLAPAAIAGAVHALPVAVQAVLAITAGDLLLYWAHRACHRVPLLWRFHAVHHSVTRLDWLAAHREHPLDGLYSQLWLNLPAILLGVDLTALAPLLVLRGLWAIFVHSNVRVPLGPLGVLFGDPALHRWHHARVARCDHNFANLAPYLDVLFGTHHRPEREDYALGLDAPFPRGIVGQILTPLAPDLSGTGSPGTSSSTSPRSRSPAPSPEAADCTRCPAR
jgi:sterol desaturase/sphingolipid hydroxylase (fatty acid hydroxylase superfamily)